MADNRDYDLGVCKIPRTDKEGNDITGDKIGKGGRHRADGTYSGPVYDIQKVDELPKPKPQIIVKREVVEVQRRPTQYEDLNPLQQLGVDVAREVTYRGLNFLGELAMEGFQNWRYERNRKKAEERAAQEAAERRARYEAIRAKREEEARIRREQEEAEKRAEEEKKAQTNIVVKEAEPIDVAFEQYSVDMTSEEAQKELFEAFVLYLLSAKKVWKVAHANIVDGDGNVIPGQDMIDKISKPELIASINMILTKNPDLLEGWQSVALSEMLGRSLVIDAEFVPIESHDFRNNLMNLACA